jgi:hypothetical protein
MYGFAGYKRSKVVSSSRGCTAWVQFENVPSADAAMRALQGSSALALDAQGLRIVFSKKPMAADSGPSSLPARANSSAAATVAPIDTLMISNMSAQASEGDLQTVMGSFPGYKRSKVVSSSRGCTAWVQFENVPSADAAMRALQGSSALALDAQGLRVVFSKNPMGVPSARMFS